MDEKSLLKQFVENHSLHPYDRRSLIEYVHFCKQQSLPIDYETLEKLPPELNGYVSDVIPWIEETIDFLKERNG